MSAAVTRPARVLIADDTADIRLLVRLILARIDDVEVVAEAVDGFDAVEQTALCRPDLVLLDLAMPRMGGLEALPLIRARAPGAAVIVLSAFDADQFATQALEAGALTYVQKCGDPAVLTAAVRAALKRAPAVTDRVDGTDTGAGFATATGPLPPDAALHRIAHELRNPAIALGVICNELTRTVTAGGVVAPDLIAAMQRQVDVVDQVTDDLLTSVQLHRGSLVLNRRRVDVRAIFDAVCASSPGQRFSVDCTPGLHAWADPNRLAQIVGNLVSNALRYGCPPYRLVGAPDAAGVRLEIVDRGGGVPGDFEPYLFDEYSQAQPDRGYGSGLGLAVVRALAEAHGGAVSYRRLDDATVFSVCLPTAPAA